jgi:hypothetical protein
LGLDAEYRQVVAAAPMPIRKLLGLITLCLGLSAPPAHAQDADLCLIVADRIDDEEKRIAHEACQRALADTSSIVQKYHLQEADIDITGTRPEN